MTRHSVFFIIMTFMMVSGCASTKVTSRNPLVSEQLPRPANIWVQEFAATAADLPRDSDLYTQYGGDPTPQTMEQVDTGRNLGRQIASELIEQIRDMGMPAEPLYSGNTPQINDIIIRGYIVSFNEGSAAKRVTIGLGSGSSELRVAAEGLQVTPQGLRKLGSGATDSGSGKTPGGALGVAGLIATGNPVGLIVSGGMKVYGEASGSAKVEGRAEKTAKEIADVLRERFEEQGWI